MRSCCSTPRTAVAGARSATSAQAPCRSTKPSSASATIHISWTCARPTVEPLQRSNAKQECRSLETTVAFEKTGDPSISVDCKKKELLGNFKNHGKEWQSKGKNTVVNVYDF